MTAAKKSIGARLIESMTEFAEALESDKPLENTLTGHSVRLALEPRSYTPAQVKAVRRLLGASHSIFAQFLGVAVVTVRAWEQGTNKPSGAAARLMDEIQSDPAHFRMRLRQAAVRRTTVPAARAARRKSVHRPRPAKQPFAEPARHKSKSPR